MKHTATPRLVVHLGVNGQGLVEVGLGLVQMARLELLLAQLVQPGGATVQLGVRPRPRG